MSCSPQGYKAFLVCCNVALLFIGASILILGAKMLHFLSFALTIQVPHVSHVINAVIATGLFISTAGVAGITGACYESSRIIVMHLCALGIIVVMQFSLGVAIIVVKQLIEDFVSSEQCNESCAAAVDSLVLDYALPSAGLMMTIIIVEAFMIYSAVKVFFYIRGKGSREVPHISMNFDHGLLNTTYTVGDAQHQNASPLPVMELSPRQMHSSRIDYLFASSSSHRRSPSPNASEQDPPSYIEASRLAANIPDYLVSV